MILAGIGVYLSEKELLDFCSSFNPLPVVSIGQKLKDFPCVLIEDHGYRNFAFINGSENSPDGGRTAMESLQSRGIRIPQDIAIVGYDDVSNSRNLTPPLTTVQQPIYEQGYVAGNMIMDLIKDVQTPEFITLPSRLIVRQSCGCCSRNVLHAAIGSLEELG